MRRSGEIEVGRQEREWGDALRTRRGDGCLSGEDLIAFVEGRLEPERRLEVIEHLGHCVGCRDTVFLLRATERAATARASGWQRFAPGLGLATCLAAVACAAVVGTNMWNSGKNQPNHGAIVALNSRRGPAGQSGNEIKRGPTPKSADPGRSSGVPNTGFQRTGPGEKQPSSAPSLTASEGKGNRTNESGKGGSTQTQKTPSNTSTAKQPDLRSMVAMSGPTDSGARAMRFCLVGQNHVYSLPTKDYRQTDRQKIEEDYADKVAADQAEYKRALESGADQATAAEALNSDLSQSAQERDSALAAIYPPADDLRGQYSELQVDGDAPYQVVEIDSRRQGPVEVVEDYQVYAPWPGYDADEVPYGWAYGVVYRPREFHSAYVTWHSGFVASGRVFCGLRSHSGPVPPDLIRQRFGPRYGLHSTLGRTFARPGTATSKYGTPAVPGGSRYIRGHSDFPTGPSRYSRTLNSAAGTGNGSSQSDGYRHSLGGTFAPNADRPGTQGGRGASRYSRRPEGQGDSAGPRTYPTRGSGGRSPESGSSRPPTHSSGGGRSSGSSGRGGGSAGSHGGGHNHSR